MNEILQFFAALHQAGVHYMVVGGYAVNHYGYSRTTSDIDIYLEDSAINRNNLIDALEQMGYGRMDELLRVPILPGYCEILMESGIYIDLMTQIKGLDTSSFAKQYENRNTILVEGIEITYISLQDLLINKKSTGRTKDKDDLEHLIQL